MRRSPIPTRHLTQKARIPAFLAACSAIASAYTFACGGRTGLTVFLPVATVEPGDDAGSPSPDDASTSPQDDASAPVAANPDGAQVPPSDATDAPERTPILLPHDAASRPEAASGDATADASGSRTTADAAADAPAEACTYLPATDASPPDAAALAPWATSMNSKVTQIARDRQGNVFAAGGFLNFTQTTVLSKFDPTGQLLWSKQFPSNWFAFAQIATDATGALVVAGGTGGAPAGSIDLGAGPLPSAGLLAKFSPDGDLVFARTFPLVPGADGLFPEGVGVLASGDIVVTAMLTGTVDLGGGPITAVGGYNGDEAEFLARYGPCGDYVFARQVADSMGESSWGTGLAIDANDDVIATGYFIGSIDFGGGPLESPSQANWDTFAAKLDSSGRWLASREFRTSEPNGGPGAPAVDGSGNAILVGSFSQPIDFGGGPLHSAGTTNVYVAKLGPKLEYVWAESFGSSDNSLGLSSAAADPSGNVFVTGSIQGTVSFGPVTLQAPALGSTLFVAKLDANGAPRAAHLALGVDAMGWGIVPTDSSHILLAAAFGYEGTLTLDTGLAATGLGSVMWFSP